LGSFSTKSRAEILPRCRRDYPLPPPINRDSVDDPREEKIESKFDKKNSHTPLFFSFSFLNEYSFFFLLLSRAFSHHHCRRRLDNHPLHHTSPSPLISSPFSSTAATAHQHHHFRFLPSWAPATATSASTSISITSFTTIISINLAPHQWQRSHRDLLSLLLLAFSLSSVTFSSSSHNRLRLPHLSQRPLNHQPNHLITTETLTPGNFLLPALPLSSSSWLLHIEFIFACSKLIN